MNVRLTKREWMLSPLNRGYGLPDEGFGTAARSFSATTTSMSTSVVVMMAGSN